MLRLRTLGRLAVERDGGPPSGAGAQRRPLALLAQLAAAGDRGLSRAKLVSLLWPDSDEEKARRVLAQTLYSLRRDLAVDDLVVGGTELRLNPAVITSDFADFVAALDRGALAEAAALYEGPFLDGFYLSGAPEFERWVEETRRYLEGRFAAAAERLACDAEQAGDRGAALEWRRRLAALDPLSGRYAAALMRTLVASGDRTGALQHARVHETLVRSELDVDPEPEVAALAKRIRDGVEPESAAASTAASTGRPAAALVAGGVGGPPHREDAPSPPEPQHRIAATATGALPRAAEPTTPDATTPVASGRGATRRRWPWLAVAAGIVAVAIGATTLQRRPSSPPAADSTAATRPVVALAEIRTLGSDTTVGWLASGLPDMIAAALLRSGGQVDVSSPAQLRDVLLRGGHDATSGLSVVRDAGRRVGATLVATGDLARVDGSLVLHLGIYEVASGKLLSLSEISGVTPFALVDAAAAKVYQAAGQTLPGPAVADVGTTSIEEYRLLQRALRASDVGKEEEFLRALDSAIALDSGFIAAIQIRLTVAEEWQQSPRTIARLRELFRRHADRATEFDRMYEEATTAHFDGDVGRAEAIAEQLVARWPRDTRGSVLLRTFYETDGRFDAAERVAAAALALDSLGIEAGQGPCAPCVGYGGLTYDRLALGNDSGALAAARRWVSLQPSNSNAWLSLAIAFQRTQRYDSALAALRRGEVITGGSVVFSRGRIRTLMMARRLDDAAREIAAAEDDARRRGDARLLVEALDLRSLLERERGRIRAQLRTLEEIERLPGGPEDGLILVHAHTLGRLGDYAGAERELERGRAGEKHPVFPVSGAVARAFSWEHALLADAIAPAGDARRLAALADSIEVAAGRSYYGRDKRLPHHVRGLVAELNRDWATAARELAAAQWPAWPWPRTSIELARSLIALGRGADAVAALRAGYRTDLDAMARYAGRSELDWWMARAFTAAGRADSARVYDGYARAAWRDADPDFLRMVGAAR